jgi:hypothetical protein
MWPRHSSLHASLAQRRHVANGKPAARLEQRRIDLPPQRLQPARLREIRCEQLEHALHRFAGLGRQRGGFRRPARQRNRDVGAVADAAHEQAFVLQLRIGFVDHASRDVPLLRELAGRRQA